MVDVAAEEEDPCGMLQAIGHAVVFAAFLASAMASLFHRFVSSFMSALQASMLSGCVSMPATLPSKVAAFVMMSMMLLCLADITVEFAADAVHVCVLRHAGHHSFPSMVSLFIILLLVVAVGAA